MHLQRPLTAGVAASPIAAGAIGSRSTASAADATSAAGANDTVAQTFDDGPDHGTTSTSSIRRPDGLRATRFGRQTAANRAPVAAGVPVANCSYTHPQMLRPGCAPVQGSSTATGAAIPRFPVGWQSRARNAGRLSPVTRRAVTPEF